MHPKPGVADQCKNSFSENSWLQFELRHFKTQLYPVCVIVIIIIISELLGISELLVNWAHTTKSHGYRPIQHNICADTHPCYIFYSLLNVILQ